MQARPDTSADADHPRRTLDLGRLDHGTDEDGAHDHDLVALRSDELRGLRLRVHSGTYRPRADDVAERVLAWLTPSPIAVTN